MGMGGYSPSQERAAQMSEEDKEIAAFLLESQPKIFVVGSGGSGCNTINRLTTSQIPFF